jgi:hypothetical protein
MTLTLLLIACNTVGIALAIYLRVRPLMPLVKR